MVVGTHPNLTSGNNSDIVASTVKSDMTGHLLSVIMLAPLSMMVVVSFCGGGVCASSATAQYIRN